MEQDRFQKHELVYITGFIFLILSLCLFALTAYIFPYLIFKWRYDVPEFIHYLNQWLQIKHHFSSVGAPWLVVISFLFLAVICALIAQRASNRMDNQIYGVEEQKKSQPARVREDTKETISLLLKIIIIVIAVFVGALLFQWIISTPPPQ